MLIILTALIAIISVMRSRYDKSISENGGQFAQKKGAGCFLSVSEFAVHIVILWLCTFALLSKWGTIPFMIIFSIILCADVHRYAKRTALADKSIVYQLLFVNLWDVIRYRSLKEAVYRQSYNNSTYGKQNEQAAATPPLRTYA